MSARPPASEAPRFVFSSEHGTQLVRETLEKILPYTPHDYQLEGVCQLLDGMDLIAVLATGAGKTGYYLMYALMLSQLSNNPRICSPACVAVPQDPCIVMVYPTNGLEEEQAETFQSVGLSTVVINSDTLERSRKCGMDLWVVARSSINVILLSPEQLTSPRFDSLLQHPVFRGRVCAMGIDEVHLLYSWGQNFRKSYQQLGHARARFPPRTRIIGTTASLLAGHPQESIFSFLGLRLHQLYLLRRSNVRPAIETRFRILTHGIGGWAFPDLKWILHQGRKTVIHCRTIAMSFRVAVYLWRLLPPSADHSKRLRLYNTLNRQAYNAETRHLMQHHPDMQIIVATASFMVGLDLPNVADVVVVGNLANADEHIQWQGRAGRDPALVRDPRFITYVTKKAMQTARSLCDGKMPRAEKPAGGGKKTASVRMELSMARLLLAPCVTAMQNVLYDNPVHDRPCSCRRCASSSINGSRLDDNLLPAVCSPEMHVLEPACSQDSDTAPCTLAHYSPAVSSASTPPASSSTSCGKCSGCVPADLSSQETGVQSTSKQTNPVARKDRLTREMRAEGTRRLRQLRSYIYRATDSAAARTLPPEIFLPETVIKQILDRFALIDSPEALKELITGRVHLLPHLDTLWDTLVALRRAFEHIQGESDAHKASLAEGETTASDHCETAAVGRGVLSELASERPPPFAQCCGSFQVIVQMPPSTRQNQVLSPPAGPLIERPLDAAYHNIQWRLYTPPQGIPAKETAASPRRKRSSTTSSIDPRPRTRARVTKANKENRAAMSQK
ncbi:hypothetical protein OH77DRAFT_1578381 [Trametes cingulata]|nr:hypothetical protein OH77DRAFT_1578381 [Trametes cingulata]